MFGLKSVSSGQLHVVDGIAMGHFACIHPQARRDDLCVLNCHARCCFCTAACSDISAVLYKAGHEGI